LGARQRERRTVEEIKGGDNSINLENINLDKRAIHIHGGMEHNMAKYARCYSCRSTEISRGSDFTTKIDYNRRDFLGYYQANARNKLYFKLGTIA
jgi:hypothetical protein